MLIFNQFQKLNMLYKVKNNLGMCEFYFRIFRFSERASPKS